MPERYWLIQPNGGRQLIDPAQFDLERLAEQARRLGGRLEIERDEIASPPRGFTPPASSLGLLFRARLARILTCKVAFEVDMNPRPTVRVLGGYYRRRALVRVYTHDRVTGRRPTEELFDTFLHEIAHHLEYTEPATFQGRRCGRQPGRMHSPLFWHILGSLKYRWAQLQADGSPHEGLTYPVATGDGAVPR
ncbi:MAG: hypothetical protein U0800_02270 [Isosphaeraceae bacterium]